MHRTVLCNKHFVFKYQIFKFKYFVSIVFFSCISRYFGAVSFIISNFLISILIISFFLFQSELCKWNRGVNLLVFSSSFLKSFYSAWLNTLQCIDLVSFIIEWGHFWQFLILQECINKLDWIFTPTTTINQNKRRPKKGKIKITE